MRAQTSAPIVYVVPINGVIDLGLAPFLARAAREAADAGASALLLDINTFGGRVDAAIAMRDTLVNSPVRTIAFVNPRAISAGALIALSCETIVMASGGTIGAAAPVVGAVIAAAWIYAEVALATSYLGRVLDRLDPSNAGIEAQAD
jgi:membrane-bound serine protease (ClpP class)